MKTELLTSEIFENMFGSYLKSKDGFNIYFETNLRESETALVFLYGLGCNILHWKYQINYFLQQKNLPHQIIWIDYRGHGKSDPLQYAEHMTFELLCSDIDEVLAARGVKKSIVLGQSMGGTVALYFAHLYAEKVDKLVLQGAPPVGPSKTLKMGWLGAKAWLAVLELNKSHRDLVRKGFQMMPSKSIILREMVRFLGFNPKLARVTDIEEYIKGIFKTDPNTFFDLAAQMEKFNVHNLNPPITAKTLIIAGEMDMCVGLDRIRELDHSLTNSTILLVNEGSHCPHLDDPNGINKQIHAFI